MDSGFFSASTTGECIRSSIGFILNGWPEVSFTMQAPTLCMFIVLKQVGAYLHACMFYDLTNYLTDLYRYGAISAETES